MDENEEFSVLSVLENATSFSTPFKDFSNSETIFSLIKEEIDIVNAEHDQTAGCQKAGKSPAYTRAKRKKNKRNSHELLRVKTNETILIKENNATSLGTLKARRSFLQKRPGNYGNHNNSHSSETSDHSGFGDCSTIPKIILENGNNLTDYNSCEDNIMEIVENARETFKDETMRASFVEESACLMATIDDPPNPDKDDDFVESSQSISVCSDLRRQLINRRSTIENNKSKIAPEITLENNLQINIGKSEQEEKSTNFIGTISPSTKSHASTRQSMPQRLRKRKAGNPLKVSTPKEIKFNGLREINCENRPETRRSKANLQSPLMPLTQELENCIKNLDYERLITEEIDTDILERTSFTFETIELLNDYSHDNPPQANNEILSEILSSPADKIKNESLEGVAKAALSPVKPNEDPLYFKENEVTSPTPTNTTKRISAINRKTSERKSLKTKGSNSRLKVANNVSSTSKRNKSIEKVTRKKRKAMETSEEGCLNNSERLRKKKKLVQISLSDLEDDENMAMEAAKVSKKLEAAEKKAALSEETLQKLDNLVICLRHKVLPQHEIESRAGSIPLTYKQQKEFIKLAPLNKDTYTPAEDYIIHENWKAFCKDHNWDPEDYKPFLLLKHGHHLIMTSLEERRKFVQFLANGLPNRPLYSVYSRFKILGNKYATAGSRYTRTEDTKILAHMLHNQSENPDKKCSELSKILNRSRVSIWKRYKKLMAKLDQGQEKTVLTKVTWDLPLVNDFITTLLNVTLSEELIELKDAFIPKVIWLKMEEKMGINHELMKRFWEQQLHLQLFSPKPLYTNQIKITLIRYMYEKQFRHPAEIKWNNIVKYFDGLTASFLRKVFNHLTAKASTGLSSRNLKTILKWLYKKEIDQLRKEPKDKCLPRISYENKRAEILPEDLERIKLSDKHVNDD